MSTIGFPWLLFYHGKDYRNKTLYNVASSAHRSSSINKLNKKTSVWGSIHDWLILSTTNKLVKRETSDPNTISTLYSLSLWNPITSESIDFPPFNLEPKHHIYSFILSSTLTDDPNTMFVLFEKTIPAIFVCRLFDQEWIQLSYDIKDEEDENHYYLDCPVSYDGKLFAIGKSELVQVEIKYDNDNTISLQLQPLSKLPVDLPPHSYRWIENLVECCGELYTVYSAKGCTYKGVGWKEIIAVSVFKLNFSEMIWEKVDNINDHAFLLSTNSAISCPATSLSSFPAQRNRIYFTLEEDKHKSVYSYHVEDGTLAMSRIFPDVPQTLIPPIWVTLPTLASNKGEKGQETSEEALVLAEERKVDEYNVFPWNNLPVDLQNMIAKKLPPFDYMEFRALCKMNSLIAPPIQLRTKLASDQLHSLSPCLIYSPIGKNICNFIDPTFNIRYVVKTPEYFQDPIVHCSKGSWLLMSSSIKGGLPLPMLLFNPFTKATLQLPPIRLQPVLSFGFSSLPYSDDSCYVVGFIHEPYKALFLITSPGMQHWVLWEFQNETDFHPSDTTPVFWDGSFYYLGEDGRLGVLSRYEDVWGWVVVDVSRGPKNFHRNYLVEDSGILLSVFVGYLGTWVQVFQLVYSQSQEGDEIDLQPLLFWDPQHDLGNKLIYVSRLSTICKVAEVAGTQNRIYLEKLYRERAIYYSLSTKKIYTSDGKDLLKSYYNTSEPLLSAWIEPRWC